MTITIRDLSYFLSVAEIGSLSQAARQCHVTQPAISKSLVRLESTLNQELFLRTSGGVVLTGAGSEFRRHAQRVVREHDEVMRYAVSCREGKTGLLKIGVTRPAFDAIVSSALIQIENVAPLIRFQFDLDAADFLLASLESGHLDMAIVPVRTELPPYLQVDVLGSDNVSAIVRVGHPILSHSLISLQALHNCRWILPKPNAHAYKWFEATFHRAGLVMPKAHLEINHAGPAVLNIVANTDYILYVPGGWNSTLPSSLTALKIPELNIQRDIGLVYRKNTFWTPAMHTFRETLYASTGYKATHAE
ncbi:LysR family transcriptional regulator [Orrella sp. 11846]|uniref:LysR family transcriptional regulator n=1 Tax=Orrella sp. 11846 TaxID=3409913 RepID=UPI003B5B5CF4